MKICSEEVIPLGNFAEAKLLWNWWWTHNSVGVGAPAFFVSAGQKHTISSSHSQCMQNKHILDPSGSSAFLFCWLVHTSPVGILPDSWQEKMRVPEIELFHEEHHINGPYHSYERAGKIHTGSAQCQNLCSTL